MDFSVHVSNFILQSTNIYEGIIPTESVYQNYVFLSVVSLVALVGGYFFNRRLQPKQ